MYMLGIFKIIKNLINKEQSKTIKEDVSGIDGVEKDVLIYLKDKLKPLYIEITNHEAKNVFDLIQSRGLLGWCWETTQTCSVFLNDNDQVERGYLFIDDNSPNYYHSWISFNFNNIEWVFDPCLDCLCLKQDYYARFNPIIDGVCSVEKIKNYIIDSIKNKSKEEKERDGIFKFLYDKLDDEYKKELDQEVTICGENDVNAEIYRGNVGYRAKFKEDKIDKLTAHYYMSGMV